MSVHLQEHTNVHTKHTKGEDEEEEEEAITGAVAVC
jgi:hypothetical protein